MRSGPGSGFAPPRVRGHGCLGWGGGGVALPQSSPCLPPPPQDSSQIGLLKELLDLQKDMVVMLLSLLEGASRRRRGGVRGATRVSPTHWGRGSDIASPPLPPP